MGWNGDILLLAVGLYSVWLATGVTLASLVWVGNSRGVEILAWACVVLQLLVAARGIQVDFLLLTALSLIFVGCGVFALRRLRRSS